MTNKKKNISSLELFVWKLVGFLFVVAWIITAIGAFLLTNQYGWDDIGVGFVVFFALLILVPASYTALYMYMLRLRPGGAKRTAGLVTQIVLSLPLIILISNYLANTNSGDPWVLSFPVGLVVGFADFMLFRKLRSQST